jgi:hypothetical protein
LRIVKFKFDRSTLSDIWRLTQKSCWKEVNLKEE